METEVLPFTALVRLTPPAVAVSATVSPVIVPPVLVTLVAAVILNAPPVTAVPACEFPEILRLPAEFRKIPLPAVDVLAETLAEVTVKGVAALVPMVPAVEVRFNVGVVTFETSVMLLAWMMVVEVTPETVLARVTPPPVAVRISVAPVIVPPVLVILVAAVMLKAPPDPAVPA